MTNYLLHVQKYQTGQKILNSVNKQSKFLGGKQRYTIKNTINCSEVKKHLAIVMYSDLEYLVKCLFNDIFKISNCKVILLNIKRVGSVE